MLGRDDFFCWGAAEETGRGKHIRCVHLIIFLYIIKEEKEKKAFSLPAPHVHWVWRGGARASPLGENVGAEDNDLDVAVYGEGMLHVPGPTQGEGVQKLLHREA